MLNRLNSTGARTVGPHGRPQGTTGDHGRPRGPTGRPRETTGDQGRPWETTRAKGRPQATTSLACCNPSCPLVCGLCQNQLPPSLPSEFLRCQERKLRVTILWWSSSTPAILKQVLIRAAVRTLCVVMLLPLSCACCSAALQVFNHILCCQCRSVEAHFIKHR